MACRSLIPPTFLKCGVLCERFAQTPAYRPNVRGLQLWMRDDIRGAVHRYDDASLLAPHLTLNRIDINILEVGVVGIPSDRHDDMRLDDFNFPPKHGQHRHR